MDFHYRLEIPPTAIAAAGVIVQVKAATYPIAIEAVRLGQISRTTSEIWRMRWTRKSAAATVIAVTASPLPTSNPTAGFNDPATGAYKASGGTLGTDGAGLGYAHWNLINGEISDLLLPDDQIQLTTGEVVALNLLSTPSGSTDIAGYLLIRETR